MRSAEEGPSTCSDCGRPAYQDPKLAAACIVSDSNSILLVKRAIEPEIGKWSFPSGYVNRGEVVAEAAAREVLEETFAVARVNWLVGLYSEVGRTVALAVYDATQIGGTIGAGDETSDARMFQLDDLPDLAFVHDRRILRDWRNERDRRGLVSL
ncbi:MAG: NUDIX domain-containing protein [Chloroflexi bacterium]|nr:NUDIX domain-containing protein [Chloroflexota bacterium]